MKKIIIAVGVIVVGLGLFFFINQKQTVQDPEQVVLGKTLSLSREYVALRYRTNKVLVDAKSFGSYDAWNAEMLNVIKAWETLDSESVELENLADKMSEEKVGFEIISSALAYDKQEISNIYDKAPAGKKIKTLAKFLGVDAKTAFKILQNDQARVQADAWNEEGDLFKTLENSAILVKDTCKVGIFVGTIIGTGGTSALVAGSTLTQTAVVVSGADLVLEITDDSAKIGLGNNNKISSVVSSVRVVTEPLATILAISDVPNNLAKGIDKFNAVNLALEQFRVSAQEGKIVGVQLPAYTKNQSETPIQVAVMQKEELGAWLESQGAKTDSETTAELENILKIVETQEAEKKMANPNEEIKDENQDKQTGNNDSVVGVWEGIMKYTPSQSASEEQLNFAFNLNNDGTVTMASERLKFNSWKQEGNVVKLTISGAEQDSYFEFNLAGDTLTFIKSAGPNSEGEWQEDFAGEDFFGGKFMEISLQRQ